MTLNTSELLLLLEQEFACLQELGQQLEQEKLAIENNDLAQLEELQPQKNIALKRLQQQANTRLEWLQKHQLPLSNDCLSYFNDQDSNTLVPLWKKLEDKYHHNQQLSATLSEIVLILRHNTQKQIKILHGQFNDAPVYNQLGKKNGLGLGRQSIQA